MPRAAGRFDVKMNPLPLGIDGADPLLARMSLDKQYHGDLAATAVGQMLSARTAVNNSAGYVAIERVTGTLDGRTGSFVLQHSATMNRGTPQLSVTVVPDSGTDALAGLSGRLDIIISGKEHSYVFDYALETDADGRA